MVTPRTGNPRGRPKGSKNQPKTIQEFVQDALTVPKIIPPKRVPGKPRGPWVHMSPEERSELSRRLTAGRDLSKNGQGRKHGVPANRTLHQHKLIVAEQAPKIARILKKMAEQGTLPDDPRAVEAIEKTLGVLRTAEAYKDILASARLILDFTKSKPTAKIEHTVRTAEDYLDEIADNDD